mgnify:CR=1 FL=1
MKDPTHFDILRSRATQHNVRQVFDELTAAYPQFEYWSGSHNKMLHHYERGGLVRHTCEIVELGLQAIPTLNLCEKVDPIEFYLAALFHDTGKMYDYVKDGEGWKPCQHRRMIHHLPRSCIIWHDIASKFTEVNARYHDLVLHAILAHHGRREAGSPVAPLTRVAWLLHLCDGISARMDDVERLDIVSHTTHGLRAGT